MPKINLIVNAKRGKDGRTFGMINNFVIVNNCIALPYSNITSIISRKKSALFKKIRYNLTNKLYLSKKKGS